MPLPAHLARAYARTLYRVAGIDLRIGRPSRALDGLLGGLGTTEAVFVTAWNPQGRRAPAGVNERRMATMRTRLGQVTSLPAEGASRGWSEAHLLVAADPRRLATIARLFRQNAIVILQRGRAPRLADLT